MGDNAKKVVLIGPYYFNNMGDPLYIETAKMLLEKMGDVEVKILDWYGKTEWNFSSASLSSKTPNRSKVLLVKCFKKIAKILFERNRLAHFYTDLLQGADVVIVPGGGFISFSATHPYHQRFRAIEYACGKIGAPFCMNAVGICMDVGRIHYKNEWEKILKDRTLRYISCRDGHSIIETLSSRKIEQVSCTAVLAGDLYGITKDENSNIIGIGVIRGNAFSMYGYDFSEDQMIDFYVSLIRFIQERTTYKPVLFTNGLDNDIKIAHKVEEKLQVCDLLIERPRCPEELARMISGFKAVVCARMHAAITAFSLDIPTVLLCWGVKGADFMAMAEASEFAVKADEINAEHVYHLLLEAMKKGVWSQERRKELQKSAVASILKLMDAVEIDKKKDRCDAINYYNLND